LPAASIWATLVFWLGRTGVELKDFVARAIAEIVAGFDEAQASLQGMQAIGSTYQAMFKHSHQSIAQDIYGNIYSVFEFDVAVTTVDEIKGGGGIKVFSIGASGEATGRAETASRIKFATTVRLK
jgi:hypothetical protein